MKQNSELTWIVRTIKESHSGSPWHGPSFGQATRGVNADMATARIPTLGHSIWELVLHLKGWIDVVEVRLNGKRCGEPEDGNFPTPKNVSSAEWQRTLRSFRGTVDRLIKSIERVPEKKLDELVPGRNHTFRPMLIGVAWHTLHHTGQISMIKNALKRRKARQ